MDWLSSSSFCLSWNQQVTHCVDSEHFSYESSSIIVLHCWRVLYSLYMGSSRVGLTPLTHALCCFCQREHSNNSSPKVLPEHRASGIDDLYIITLTVVSFLRSLRMRPSRLEILPPAPSQPIYSYKFGPKAASSLIMLCVRKRILRLEHGGPLSQ